MLDNIQKAVDKFVENNIEVIEEQGEYTGEQNGFVLKSTSDIHGIKTTVVGIAESEYRKD